jgi:CRISPR system Cascade subunit CasB
VTADLRSTDTPLQRRKAFVNHLYGLHTRLVSDNHHQAAEARQVLARLRRAFNGPRQEAEAYDVVFHYDPPEAEQETWLLLAALFALHPQPRTRDTHLRTLGAAMGALAKRRGESVNRRFVQLVSVDWAALRHYLRQAVQLLRSDGIPLDYQRLLEDLLVLQRDPRGGQQAHRVRLAWTREFHLAQRPQRPTTSDETTVPTE